MGRESEPLSYIAPDDLRNADQGQDRPVNGPMHVTDHESDAEGEVKALQDPDDAYEDHCNAEQAADYAHRDIE
jgi:hypothetical protein